MQLIISWIDIAQHFEHTTADSLKPILEYMDDELEALLVENNSGEILIFADSDNGDSLGWRLSDFGGEQEPKVLKIPARSFEAEIIALNVRDLLTKMIEAPKRFWLHFKPKHHKKYSV